MKNNKKILILIFVFIFLGIIGYLAHLYFYNHSVSYYSKVKYGKNVQVEKQELVSTVNDLTINEFDYVKSAEAYIGLAVPISGMKEAKYIKNGTMAFKVYFENQKPYIEITEAKDINQNSYLNDIKKIKYEININKLIPKYVLYDQENLYILTEKGNVYYYYFPHVLANADVEEYLESFSNNPREFYYTEVAEEIETSNGNKGIRMVGKAHLYQNIAVKYNNIYGVKEDGTVINIKTNTEINKEYAAVKRFGNGNLFISQNGNIKSCSYYDEKGCDSSNTGPIITDENGKTVIVSMLMIDDMNGKFYVIDVNKNLYYCDYIIEEPKIVTSLKFLSKKKVDSLYYIYNPSDSIIKEITIKLKNNSFISIPKMYRINIYNLSVLTTSDQEK